MNNDIGKSIKSMAPLTPDIAGLPTIMAEPWVQINDDPNYFLEGPTFDNQGIFYCTNPKVGHVYTVTPEGRVTKIYDDFELRPICFAFHKDGRLFWTAEKANGPGTLCYSNPDLTEITEVTPRHEGKPTFFNDLDFNPDGVLYITDSTGRRDDPSGGVYAFSPNMQQITPIVKNLVVANGIALSPAGSAPFPEVEKDTRMKSGYIVKKGTPVEMLWIGESGTSNIIRITFTYTPDGPLFSRIASYTEPYHVTGAGPTDGMECDSNNNVYISAIQQGMVLILNKNGVPIAKVLIPGRDQGIGLKNTNLTIKPGTDEGFITASGGTGPAKIYRFKALGKARKVFR